MILLECIKGYAHEEGVVCLQGDIVEVFDTDEGMVYLEGKMGWCARIELNFSPKIIAEHFKFYHRGQD